MPGFDTGVGDRLSLHVENPPGDEKRLAGGALREISAMWKVRRVRHVERPEDGRQRGALGLGHRHLVNEGFESGRSAISAEKLLASAFAELAGHREIVTCSDPFVGRQTNVPRKAMEMLDERGHQLSHGADRSSWSKALFGLFQSCALLPNFVSNIIEDSPEE